MKNKLVQMYGIRYQPTPVKDFMNFKVMESGSEILLNLENHKHLTDHELLGGLLELRKRVKGVD